MNPTGPALSCSHTNVKKFYCWQFVCLTLQVRLCNCHRLRFTSTPLLRLVEHVITGVWVLDLVTIRGWTNNHSQQPLSGILKEFTVYIDAILIGCVRIGYVCDTATIYSMCLYSHTITSYIMIYIYIYALMIYMYGFKTFYSNSADPIVATRVLQNHWWSSVIIPLANWLTGPA